MTFHEALQIVNTITPEQIEAICEIEEFFLPIIMTGSVLLILIFNNTMDRIEKYINKRKKSGK